MRSLVLLLLLLPSTATAVEENTSPAVSSAVDSCDPAPTNSETASDLPLVLAPQPPRPAVSEDERRRRLMVLLMMRRAAQAIPAALLRQEE
jgi:hypothetical protein